MPLPPVVLLLAALDALALHTTATAPPSREASPLQSAAHVWDARFAAPCESIYLPPELCPACPLLPYNATGGFANPRHIHDIDAPACRAALQRYVSLNPCDYVRRAQLADMAAGENRGRIAAFLYAVCELCCDCVPIGSRVWQYAERKAAGNLSVITRGNCAVHLYTDVCRMWPRVRNVVPPGGPRNLYRAQVCPLVGAWYGGPASQGWAMVYQVRGLDWRIKRLLWQMKTYATCEEVGVWKECVALEVAQGHV